MSAATSPGTGLAYGLRRVCAAWGMARSSFYAMTSGQHAEQPPAKRRGPKPAISDQALLVAIEADLEASPWEGEGYRKVWARLRVCRDIRVARKRVLHLMRENNLLSPHRCRRRGGNPHDGEIITHAPNLMWGTDGVRVFTVDDGWGWIFTAVEHWNAECVGWHVCKRGDRFAALQPISMGLAGLYGSTAAGAARGLALRMDHGSQYLSDHFTNQIKFWGIQPSLRLRRRAPDQRRRRAVQSHAEGTDHPWSHLPQHRGAAGRRPRLRRTLQCPLDRRKERLPEPRSSSSGVARRDLNQARRVRQTCVQGTGCATQLDPGPFDLRYRPRIPPDHRLAVPPQTPQREKQQAPYLAGYIFAYMADRPISVAAIYVFRPQCVRILWREDIYYRHRVSAYQFPKSARSPWLGAGWSAADKQYRTGRRRRP